MEIGRQDDDQAINEDIPMDTTTQAAPIASSLPFGASETEQGEPDTKNQNKQSIPVKITDNRDQTFSTLEPYQRPARRGRGRGRRSNLHRLTQEQTSFPDHIPETYVKFFNVASNNGSSLSEINVIKANRQIETLIRGTPKSITETRAGHLVVEVRSAEQSRDLQKLKLLDTTEVTVEPHRTLNTTKGTIYYRNHPGFSTQDLLEELTKFNVSEIYQTKRRMNGVMIDQPIYILTFQQCTLPSEIKIGWTRCSVRLHVPKPRRCPKCQRFGHGAKTCREETGTCHNCSEEIHELPCTRPSRCPNCDEDHPATSTSCFYYKLEQEIIAIQTKDRIAYPEAKRIVSQRYIKPKTTFADVLKSAEDHHSETDLNKPSRSRPPVQRPRTSSINTRPTITKLTTGKITLQQTPVTTAATALAPDTAALPVLPEGRGEDRSEDDDQLDQEEARRNINPKTLTTAEKGKTVKDRTPSPTKNTLTGRTKNLPTKPPLVSITAWEGESSHRKPHDGRSERKRSLGSEKGAVAVERASKRMQAPIITDPSRRQPIPPMPPNMPTYYPNQQAISTKPKRPPDPPHKTTNKESLK